MMMKLVRVLYVVFISIGIVRNDLSMITLEKSRIQKIGETAGKKNMNKQEVVSGCPNPFKLDQMGVKITHELKVQDGIEIHIMKLTTQADLNPEKYVCKYQMYCAAVQVQAFEGFLGAMPADYQKEKDELQKQQDELQNAKKILEERQEQLRNAEENLQKLNKMLRRFKKKKKFVLLVIVLCIIFCGDNSNDDDTQNAKDEQDRITALKVSRQIAVDAKQTLVDNANKDVNQEKQDVKEAKLQLKIAKGTCGQCPGDFELNLRPQPMVQVLKQNDDQTQYFSNEATIVRRSYAGKFNQDLTEEPPIIKSIDCYVSFLKAGLVLVGDSYGKEVFGSSSDMFRNSFLVSLGDDYRLIMDMKTKKDGYTYLPELTKLKHDLQMEGCLENCVQVAEIGLSYNRVNIRSDKNDGIILDQLEQFEEQFNKQYLETIKYFIKSNNVVYDIEELCAKIVKLIRFASFRNGELVVLATDGNLSDMYNGNDLNVNELGIHSGFRNQHMMTYVTFDRACMVNKMFGRGMYQ